MSTLNDYYQNKPKSIFCLFVTIGLIAVCDFVFFVKTQQYSAAILGVLACTSLHLLPIYIFRNNIKVYIFLLFPVFALLPFNFSSIAIFNVPVTDTTILLILNTNLYEVKELVKGYIFYFTIGVGFYIGIILYLFSKIPKKISKEHAKIVTISSLVVLIIIPLFNTERGSYFFKMRTRFYTIFPTSFLYASRIVYKQHQLINETRDERNAFVFHAKQDTALVNKQIHVLIIGESARYSNWSVNGYSRNTTPRLSKRDNLIVFNNAMSGGFITEFAVPLMLTGVGADNFHKHIKQKGITGVFKESGFTTYWLTHQVDDGHIKIHIGEADQEYKYLTDSKATKHVHRDLELVTKLKEILLRDTTNKKFIVLHTMGSHYDYSVRYPDDFDYFKPSNKTVFSNPANKAFKNVLLNSYDNSIRYTDFVIDSVIDLVSSQQTLASVTYMADHGENLFDDSRNLSQHAYPVPSKYIAHVPFFVWYSSSLERIIPYKIENLKRHINDRISSENLIYTLSSLGSIKYPSQDSTKNITSPYFKNNRQLILGANNKVYPVSVLK